LATKNGIPNNRGKHPGQYHARFVFGCFEVSMDIYHVNVSRKKNPVKHSIKENERKRRKNRDGAEKIMGEGKLATSTLILRSL